MGMINPLTIKMELGRRVKKLIGQNKFNLNEIASLCNSSIEECATAYENYTGKKIFVNFLMIGNKKTKYQIRKLILDNQKILLFGDIGVGKSSLIKEIANEIGWNIKISYPTNNDDLLKDFANVPLVTKNTVFVIEGDSFYWRSYALVNHYIKESNNPIIIIVNDKNTVNANVSKQLVTVKLHPPTRQDVEEFVRKRYPEWKGNINDIYDKDLRITFRKLKYGIPSYKPKEYEERNAQQVAYKILQGKVDKEDLEHCKEPVIYYLNWLGNNANKFYSDLSKIDYLSFYDSVKYNYKKCYLDTILLNLGKGDKRAKMIFPPIKYKPPKEKEDDDWKHKRAKKRKKKEKKVEEKQSNLNFGSDMIL